MVPGLDEEVAAYLMHGFGTGYTGKRIDIVGNIGIGGSDIGPVTVMVTGRSRRTRNIADARMQTRWALRWFRFSPRRSLRSSAKATTAQYVRGHA
jgi:hypothetical protein